ncbi:unnamed protein product [Sphacelaria rigidula]
MRCALEKAGEAAARYTIEVSKEMKAFDGPPLGPRDVRELLLRVFRIKLSVPEATALVAYFTKVMGCNVGHIEHGDFIHSIQRLRRGQENNNFPKREKRALIATGRDP